MKLMEFNNKLKSIIYTHSSLDSVVNELRKTDLNVRIFGQYREIGGERVKVYFHNLDITDRYTFIKVEYGRRFKEFIVYTENVGTKENTAWHALALFKQWYIENQ